MKVYGFGLGFVGFTADKRSLGHIAPAGDTLESVE